MHFWIHYLILLFSLVDHCVTLRSYDLTDLKSPVSFDPSKLEYEDHRIRKRQVNDDSEVATISDNHNYYTSKIIKDPNGIYWNELEGHVRHNLSNDKYLRYSFVQMSFNFTYYGHKLDKFAITTQGFLYMSEFTHPDLDWTFTHYIAPLMGNFDTVGNDSHILYKDDGTSFVVEWRNVELNDQQENGKYTFQTTLFENGTILFGYKSIPSTNISGNIWPVKIGISDAYYFDVEDVLGEGGHVRIIAKYHSIDLDINNIGNNTAIVLEPLPTCIQTTSCENCTTLKSAFECTWCDTLSRCSDGIDRHRQEWLTSNCNKHAHNSTDKCFAIGSVNSDAVQSDGNKSEGRRTTLIIVIPIAVVVVVLLVFLGMWIFYARTHPNSRSGIWLIEHSPRMWKEKLSEIKFSKDSKESDIAYENNSYGVQADRDVGEINMRI